MEERVETDLNKRLKTPGNSRHAFLKFPGARVGSGSFSHTINLCYFQLSICRRGKTTLKVNYPFVHRRLTYNEKCRTWSAGCWSRWNRRCRFGTRCTCGHRCTRICMLRSPPEWFRIRIRRRRNLSCCHLFFPGSCRSLSGPPCWLHRRLQGCRLWNTAPLYCRHM